MAADNDFDAHNPNDEPKQISRRALLKELSKAPGVMGALMVPTAWATPLMEFAVGAPSIRCSTTPNVTSCSGTVLSLPFGSNNTVTWSAAWYGLTQGNAITAVLDPANKKVRVTVASPFTISQASPGSVDVTGTAASKTAVTWAFNDDGTPVTTLAVNLTNGANGLTCSYAAGPYPVIITFSMDMAVTGTSATGYALSVRAFHSPNC